MRLLLLSVFFCWSIFREIANPTEGFNNFSLGYMSVLAFLAFACARPAYKTWSLESFLSEQATRIAERPGVKVKCNSVFDTLFDGKGLQSLAGTAYPDTGEIFFESGWCKNFMGYMDDPENPSQDELFGMHVFTHEVMHIRGDLNEKRTDCQAIQRNQRVGELMGIESSVARINAQKYYHDFYPKHPYFDKECKRNGKYDEHLTNSIW
ncbi:MAG: hypothetical protein ACI9LY_002792 [Arenicella sp.]